MPPRAAKWGKGLHDAKAERLVSLYGQFLPEHYGGSALAPARRERFDVYSAGTDPKGINPLATKVLEEIGIDTSGLRSKPVTEYLGKLPCHFVIVVCDSANETCPRIFPGMRERLFWPFDDPPAFQGTDEEKLNKFREVRDAIDVRIKEWLATYAKSDD